MIEPKITMMSCKDGWLSGKVVLNGKEWVVKPFQVASDASPNEKENALLKQALSERENDGMETVKVSIGEL
tara:strand:- start:199 stop:411 length:213 start_codon:yes stop_codon:yes gene_type:complete